MKLGIRNAVKNDSRDLFEWRNDDVTRQKSRTSERVEFDTHEHWFADVLGRDDRMILIGELESPEVGPEVGKVGVVRFDRNAETAAWHISINLNPALRGRKLSGALLEAAIRVFDSHHGGTQLAAEIKDDNVPSQKIFLGAGFNKTGMEGDFGQYSRKP